MKGEAFQGGHDVDGEQLFICRSHKYGQIIPGKYSNTLEKCSVTHNRREVQFSRYEILLEGADTRYEWIALKKPVISLPENVLYGGSQFDKFSRRMSSVRENQAPVAIIDLKGQLNSHSLDHILSNDQMWGFRKRRMRRSINFTEENYWSRNWRGSKPHGLDRVHLQPKLYKRDNSNMKNFTLEEVHKAFMRPCIAHPQIATVNQMEKCPQKSQKDNFYISKCALRTGNITSEQIGKIRWIESIQEWIASFGFGGQEIYCLDYSVLTLKA